MVLSVRGRYVGEIRGYMRADLAARFEAGTAGRRRYWRATRARVAYVREAFSRGRGNLLLWNWSIAVNQPWA